MDVTYGNIYGMVGNTPHVRVRCGELEPAEIYVKLEGCNPTGSIKDRTCVRLLRDVVEKGEIKHGMTLLDASSGNLGCALAYYAKLMGHKVFIVSSSKLTPAKRDFMTFYGAKVEQIGNWTIEGNRCCRDLARERPEHFCFLDQLHNWNNPRAHYETTGPEILAAFPDAAMVVGSLGSGGSLLGTGQYIKEHAPHIRVAAVQAAIGTRLPGTASLDEGDYVTPFIEKAYSDKVFDYTFKVGERDAIAGTLRLRDQGIFVGLQTGGVFHAAAETIKEQSIKGKVIFLSGDSGWKNMDKLLAIGERQIESDVSLAAK
jgi:cysteine synthase